MDTNQDQQDGGLKGWITICDQNYRIAIKG